MIEICSHKYFLQEKIFSKEKQIYVHIVYGLSVFVVYIIGLVELQSILLTAQAAALFCRVFLCSQHHSIINECGSA